MFLCVCLCDVCVCYVTTLSIAEIASVMDE